MRPMRLWAVVTDQAATPPTNDSTADPCAALAWVSIVVIGRGLFLAAARMVALDGRDNTDRTLLVGPGAKGNPTSSQATPNWARPVALRSAMVARPSKSTSKSSAGKSTGLAPR